MMRSSIASLDSEHPDAMPGAPRPGTPRPGNLRPGNLRMDDAAHPQDARQAAACRPVQRRHDCGRYLNCLNQHAFNPRAPEDFCAECPDFDPCPHPPDHPEILACWRLAFFMFRPSALPSELSRAGEETEEPGFI